MDTWNEYNYCVITSIITNIPESRVTPIMDSDWSPNAWSPLACIVISYSIPSSNPDNTYCENIVAPLSTTAIPGWISEQLVNTGV